MWALQNDTPFAADRTIVIDPHGARHWVVVVKATFMLHPDGSTELAREQVPPQITPEYTGAHGASTLRYETDLVAGKLRTDVYLNATAHAPEGRPCTEVTVGIQLAMGQPKRLRVTGDRVWERNAVGQLQPTSPRPFVTLPIVYERAHGGWDRTELDPHDQKMDAYNPIGTGVFARASHRLGKLLPNVSHTTTTPGPAGFGAICGHWQPRLGYMGTYDASWFEHQRPLLPTDYSPLALQCAPADQQFEPYLRGGAVIDLFNLTPGGRLRFALPERHLGFRTHFGPREREHQSNLDTVIIEPDEARLMMVWRTVLACHHQIDDIDHTHIWERSRA